TKAFERAIAELYRSRGHESEPLGELRSWKAYPGSTKTKWEATPAGLQLRDPSDESWLARDFPVGRGFTVTIRFAPAGAASWAGVAISPMSDKSFRLLHVLRAEAGLLASLVDRAKDKVQGKGEKAIAAGESHEFAIVERGGKFACFVDGHFVGWEDGPGPGARLSIGVNRGVIDVTEVRIAR
ncbi:MAG TPA: hypothetical protein VJU16_07500, partial [Planctomycetota bacterium]|nr:hypothetical protein [Planctomycetota bacterium]